ncbi:hypothetical protein [Stenotrophomonas rhizophila]
MSIQFDPEKGDIRVVVCVRGGDPGDLNKNLVAGAMHTLNSICALDHGAMRRKLIACLGRQVRSLKRNEDNLRAAKRGEGAC